MPNLVNPEYLRNLTFIRTKILKGVPYSTSFVSSANKEGENEAAPDRLNASVLSYLVALIIDSGWRSALFARHVVCTFVAHTRHLP